MSRLALLAAASAALLTTPAAAARADWSTVPVTPLDVGASVTGSLDPADLDDKDLWRDWYVISAEAGETLTFSIEGGGEEPHLWLYRAQGRNEPVSLQGALVLSGWKREFSYQVRESGQYLLSVASKETPGGVYRVAASSDRRPGLAVASQPPKTVPVETAAPSQRIDVDPVRKTTFETPIPIRQGDIIDSEISESDSTPMPLFREEHFLFTGRAGETITAGVKTDIPLLIVIFQDEKRRELARGFSATGPAKIMLPRDGTYHMVVTSGGSRRYGKYELSFQSSAMAPTTVQLAEAPKPAPPPAEASPPAPPVAASKPQAPPKPAAPSALPKLTPPPGVLAAEIGKSMVRPAGKAGMQLDLYGFIGEAGSVVEANVVGVGGYGVTLYTPEGAEMLTQSGIDAARLMAVLPQDAVYILAVARQDAAKPYKLSLAAQQPDIFQWAFRQGAGYEITDDAGKLLRRSCWVAPGQTLRLLYANGSTSDVTLQAGGAGRVETKGGSNTFTTHFEGGQFTRTFAQGTPATWSIDRPPPRLGAYRGYLCD